MSTEHAAAAGGPDRGLARLAWLTLAVTLAVILWGAFVRATGSGAGCGSHWPTCNGVVIPREPEMATVIEFTHRLTSGLALLMVVALAALALRRRPAGDLVRRVALLALAFMITEALIGAALVLLEHVADDASLARAGWMIGHLLNTFLLLAALGLTAWLADGRPPPRWRAAGAVRLWLALGLLGVMAVGASGAVAALGDTLFPARSLAEALRQDLSPTAHLFVRLRVWHPVLAVLAAVYLVALCAALASGGRDTVRRLAVALAVLVTAQLGLGVVNVLLHAPVWMQLVHLLVADLVWLALVWLGAAALADDASAAASVRAAADAASEASRQGRPSAPLPSRRP